MNVEIIASGSSGNCAVIDKTVIIDAGVNVYPEGIYKYINGVYEAADSLPMGATPRKAYAALIDQINGKGTWDSNPWVWVYDYELYKNE